MGLHSLFSRFCHFPIPHRAAVTLVTLIGLAWSSKGFCGEIHDAARDGDLAKVTALLKGDPNLVFSKDAYGDGATPLHWAAQTGQKDVAELLLASNAKVNAKTDDGETPLHYAAAGNHKDLVELLRQHGGKNYPLAAPLALGQGSNPPASTKAANDKTGKPTNAGTSQSSHACTRRGYSSLHYS